MARTKRTDAEHDVYRENVIRVTGIDPKTNLPTFMPTRPKEKERVVVTTNHATANVIKNEEEKTSVPDGSSSSSDGETGTSIKDANFETDQIDTTKNSAEGGDDENAKKTSAKMLTTEVWPNQFTKPCATLPLKHDCLQMKKSSFSVAIKPPRSGPSETALRLRRYPMRVFAAR